MIPGNNLEDNWYMGSNSIEIDDLEEFKERIIDLLSKSYKLRTKEGMKIKIRLDQKGYLIIE